MQIVVDDGEEAKVSEQERMAKMRGREYYFARRLPPSEQLCDQCSTNEIKTMILLYTFSDDAGGPQSGCMNMYV
jgi:hypothetical protein